MSWISSWFNNEPQTDAQNRMMDESKRQADWWKDMFTNTQGQISTAVDTAKANATDLYGRNQSALNDVFTSQAGPVATTIKSIRDTGRAQAAKSGLIGGGQEASFVNPQLTELGNNVTSQAANAQLGLLNNYSNTLAGLDQSQIQALQSLLGIAGNGVQGAAQNTLSSLGQYTSGPFDKMLQVAGLGTQILGLPGVLGKG